MNRPLYHPTPDEIMRACEVLMCHGLSQEARRAIREILQRMEAANVEHRA